MSKLEMLNFVEVPSEMPTKRIKGERVADFDEIYRDYSSEAAAVQASRCSQCGVPYCQTHCPLHNNIPDWLKLSAEGRLKEAYFLSQETNTFPEICGRICPQDRLCEGNCVIEQAGHGTVTIGSIEKYLTDLAWERGWVEAIKPAIEHEYSVGIIGAGPAGLAAADVLRRHGIKVVIFDQHDRPGGLLTYGIPGFKLEKSVVMKRINQLVDGGVEFQLNCRVGQDIKFPEIRAKYDSVLVATGVYKSRDIKCPGIGLDGIVQAIDYLTASNRKSFGDTVADFESGMLNAQGKNVVVIGGGDTAMDCVRTAVRQGAKSVKCYYRRDQENMPGSRREVLNAQEEGVEFIWLTAPKGFSGKESVEKVLAKKMRLSDRDATGRRTPVPIPEADFDDKADLVIKALGFEPENLPRDWNVPELQVTGWGTIKTNFRTHETNLSGVFAGGDIVRGASLVVWAIRDGREAADTILKQFQNTLLAQAA